MADKDEVEPTDESTSTPPSDATPDPTDGLDASQADDSAAEDASAGEPAAEKGAIDEVVPVEVAKDGDKEFDDIVRGSGIGTPAEPTDAVAGDPEPDADRGELEPAGIAAVPAVGAAGGVPAREQAQARRAKEAATRRRDQTVKPERTGPVKFIKESIGELRKVVYPTGQQLMSYFVVVLVFVLFIIAYVGLLDLGLGWVLFRVIGGKS